MKERNRRDANALNDVLRGAAAGMAATYVMDRVTTHLYEHEGEETRQAEDRVRGHLTAYDAAAEKAAAAVGIELTEEDRGRLGQAIHWALGTSAGVAYALSRRRLPMVDAGAGLVFGTAFWLIVDEGANYALRLTPPPRAFPWQTHARGLFGHLAFGLVARAALQALSRSPRAPARFRRA